MIKKQTLIVFILLCTCYFGFGQISISGLGPGNTYTQDFNTLANSGTSSTLPTGWSFLESGTNANVNYSPSTGSSNVGDTYSFGSASNSERSFGVLQSGSLVSTIGVNFTNNTGSIVTELIISYTGEQWRLGETARVDRLDFQYSTNATSLATGTWLDENNLDFTAPITAGTIASLDGNSMLNKTSISFTITGLAIPSGSTFWLRWNDFNATGADDGLGIDDFSVYATATLAPEINVEGNLGSFPDITNGSNTPSPTNNTLFAAQFIGASQSKSYRINNEGTADLILSTISISGTNASDFTISIAPSTTISPSTFSILEITFSPLGSGERNGTVSITNNDADENLFTFAIRGTGKCVSGSLSISPLNGSVGTAITVSGTNFGPSTTAKLSGINALVTVLSSTTIKVMVPNNAKTGNLEIVNDLGCTSSILFNVIDKIVGGCEGGSPLSDLIISEVTDATTGGVTYIEIFNGTGGNVQLNNYSLEIYSNGSATASGTVPLDPGNLSNNSTYVVAIGVTGTPDSSNTCSIIGGNGQLANKTSGTSGINKKDNQHDAIRLLSSGGTVVVDQFGVHMDSNWMDATTITGDRGFNFRRLITASPLPNPSGFSHTDWNIIDWVGSGQSSCSSNDYSDIGYYDFSTANPPLVSSGPTINSSCNSATISVSGNEGYFEGNGLTYRWYYSAPGESGWTALTNDATYNNVTTSTLNILDTSLLESYQYYCQIRENDSSCYKASDAVQLTLPITTWNGTTWSNGVPSLGTKVILNGNYDTNTNGNFSACSLIVNNGNTLNIADGTYIEVENNLTVDGSIIVQPQGAFVQNNDSGSIDGAVLSDKSKVVVTKTTTKANNWYEYTYWSSPVVGEIIADGLFESSTNRRFLFNAQNYLDHCAETGNNNICDDNGGLGLQDGIDDDGNDWEWVSGATVMQRGVGYASTHNSTMFYSTFGCPGPTCSIEYTFEGPFNNGFIPVSIYRNDSELNDTNSNFIGNPYPSAISVDDFFNLNVYDVSSNPTGTLEGVIYLWSQNTQPSPTANGNQNLNFSDLDYAIINGIGETAGGDGLIPTRYIPSGQGFFVNYSNSGAVASSNGTIKTGEVIFNNALRVKGTTDNSQFFRTSQSKPLKTKGDFNKLWVNLSSEIGGFNQILIGYVNGATNDFDGSYYDVPRSLTPKTALALYSLIPDDKSNYAIQGKDPNSLDLDESIPLGFYTAINEATIYTLSIAQFKGDFFNINTVYIKDHLMNIVHNLSESDYTFTSEVGEFKDRFELTFQSGPLSDNSTQLNLKNLSIIEQRNGMVQFKINNNLTIKSVQIMDVLGRALYQLKGSSSSEIYNLSNLSQSVYIARVELDNGQIITKRALKRR